MANNRKEKIYSLYRKNGKGRFLLGFTRVIMNAYLRTFYKVKSEGTENMPENGPYLIYSNHETAMDMFFIGIFCKKYIRWMAKDALFKNRFIGWILRHCGAFSAGRLKTGLGSSIKTASRLLSNNEIVGIFPEGHRRRVSEQVGYKVHGGVAMLGMLNDVPIIPVHLITSGKKFSEVKVVFGEPFKIFDKEAHSDQDNPFHLDKEKVREESENMMKRLYEL